MLGEGIKRLVAAGTTFHGAVGSDLVLLAFLLAGLRAWPAKGVEIRYKLCTALVAISAFLTFVRWFWLAGAAIAAMIAILERSRWLYARRVLSVVLLCAMLIVLSSAVPTSLGREDAIQPYIRGLAEEIAGLGLSGEVPDVSVMNRLYELEGVYSELRTAGSFLIYLVGFGLGAEYMPASPAQAEYYAFYEPYGGLAHTIHNTYVTVLFRMGIIGALSFLFFILTSLRAMYFLFTRRERYLTPFELQTVRAIFVIFVVLTLLIANVKFALIGEIQYAILLGMIGILWRKAERGRAVIAGSERTGNKIFSNYTPGQ
jgi:O-antigen ligase